MLVLWLFKLMVRFYQMLLDLMVAILLLISVILTGIIIKVVAQDSLMVDLDLI